ncbi:MAG: PIN domain-containing protein [Myxococcales bacterium]|nr:PIN domain-containing protein [Myxococcales bacterium]
MIFADTSALYAVLVRNDAGHRKARAGWEEHLCKRERLRTTSYVIHETLALLQARLGLEAARKWRSEIEPVLDVAWVDLELHARALTALIAASRRNLSLTDWVSFELMRAEGIKTAFTLDRHFEEQGFVLFPR